MSIKLYVGNLPFKTRNDDLREHFSQAGEVADVQVLRNRRNDRSHGMAFVDMANLEAAQNAIDTFNEEDYEGRKLSVCLARPEMKS